MLFAGVFLAYYYEYSNMCRDSFRFIGIALKAYK